MGVSFLFRAAIHSLFARWMITSFSVQSPALLLFLVRELRATSYVRFLVDSTGMA